MSVLQAYLQGKQARRQTEEANRMNAMQQFIGQNAQGIMAGDENALAGIARYDPMLALNVRGQNQSYRMNEEQLRMQREQLRLQGLRLQRDEKTRMDQAQAEALARTLVAANAAYKAGDQEGYYQILEGANLDPAQYPFESFPQNAMLAEGFLEGVQEYNKAYPTQAPNAREQKISELMQNYPEMTRQRAAGIVDGVIKPSRNPVSGLSDEVNIATGTISPLQDTGKTPAATGVPGEAPGREAGLEPDYSSITPEDYRAAFTLGGKVTQGANVMGDVAGFGRFEPGVGDAITRISDLNVQAMLMLSADFPGRPSNLTREKIEEVLPKPGLTGPERGESKARQTYEMLADAVDGMQAILDNPGSYKPEARSEAARLLPKYRRLMADYGEIVQGLSGGSGNVNQDDLDLMNQLLSE